MKFKITMKTKGSTNMETYVESEDIKQALRAIEYSTKKLGMEIVGVNKVENEEKENSIHNKE